MPHPILRAPAALARELDLRRADPLQAGYAQRTARQRAFILSTAREKVAEGGNQSGKTDTGVIDFLLDALGRHPGRKWVPRDANDTWRGWYSTTTMEKFSEQAWKHFRRYLFFPGEQTQRLPTRRVLAIAGDQRNPETPNYLKLRRADGRVAECWVQSYAQGAGEFQAAEVDKLVLDEECPENVYQEAQPRVVKRGGQIVVTATPVLGVAWLEELRAAVEEGNPDVFHTRFPLAENPGVAPREFELLAKKYKNWPAGAKLRLEGFPLAEEGKVYPDSIFNPVERVVKPFGLAGGWTLRRCIDHGVNTCAAVWLATAPGGKKHAVYREYYGEGIEPVVGDGESDHGNARNIRELSRLDGGEGAYADNWIDRATLGSGQETGTPLITLWHEAGLEVGPCPDNSVESGIEQVKRLMLEVAPDGSPRLVIFETCANLLRELSLIHI